MSNNRRRLCQTFLNYTQNHERLALLLLAFTGLMSACSKDDPVPQDGSLTPDSPEGREAVTIPDEFLRTYLLKYFDFDRNGELSRYEASLVVRIDCPGI